MQAVVEHIPTLHDQKAGDPKIYANADSTDLRCHVASGLRPVARTGSGGMLRQTTPHWPAKNHLNAPNDAITGLPSDPRLCAMSLGAFCDALMSCSPQAGSMSSCAATISPAPDATVQEIEGADPLRRTKDRAALAAVAHPRITEHTYV